MSYFPSAFFGRKICNRHVPCFHTLRSKKRALMHALKKVVLRIARLARFRQLNSIFHPTVLQTLVTTGNRAVRSVQAGCSATVPERGKRVLAPPLVVTRVGECRCVEPDKCEPCLVAVHNQRWADFVRLLLSSNVYYKTFSETVRSEPPWESPAGFAFDDGVVRVRSVEIECRRWSPRGHRSVVIRHMHPASVSCSPPDRITLSHLAVFALVVSQARDLTDTE